MELPLFERSLHAVQDGIYLSINRQTKAFSFYSKWAGIFLSDRTGESRTQRNASEPPSTAIPIAVRKPRKVPSNPPVSPPRGIVPQTRKRIVAFIRPCRRNGTIACLRLTWLTL